MNEKNLVKNVFILCTQISCFFVLGYFNLVQPVEASLLFVRCSKHVCKVTCFVCFRKQRHFWRTSE